MSDEHELEDDDATETAEAPAPANDSDWASLLQFLQMTRGFDFRGYKPNTLARRIQKRMGSLGIAGYAAYQDYLEVHPDEFATLFNTILINVTSFFRDPHSWEVLRNSILPQILSSKQPGEAIRAWSAGCASGEEAYTIAMLLAEAIEPDEFRDRVKIYATDIDEDALNSARHATYTPRQVEVVPHPLLERYFEHVDGSYIFRKDLRRQVIFGRHDLISDAPISRIDLLVCRNTLMYFNAETQARVLARFHFALNDGGFLFLGRAETMMTQGQTFVPVDLKRRLSRKVSRGTLRERLLTIAPNDEDPGGDSVQWQVHAAALEASPVAQIVVDAAGTVVLVNDRARAMFGLRGNEVGRPLRDLQVSYRPVELRSVIDRAEAEGQPVTVREVEWRFQLGESRWIDLHVAPLGEGPGGGTVITFTDVTAYRRLQRELEQSHQELETAYEELQSTNEELETMNEELQSTNEELQTINDKLRQRGEELNSANAFLQSVMTSLRGGVAVVDRELRLLAWSRHAEDLWGLRSDEVTGHHLLNLDIGLPVERLRPALKACLAGDSAIQQVVLEAINRRGKQIQCEVTCTPLLGRANDVMGAILVMEEFPDGGRRSG